MKIRTAFVSNSSSSSFILEFDRPIVQLDDLMAALGVNPTSDSRVEVCDYTHTTKKATELIKYMYDCLLASDYKQPLSKDQILYLVEDEFSEDHIPDLKDRNLYGAASSYAWEGKYDTILSVLAKYQLSHPGDALKLSDPKRRTFLLEYSAAQIEYANGLADSNEMMKILRNKYIPAIVDAFFDPRKFYYEAEFSDGDGQIGSYVEHEGFEAIKKIRFSHH